MVFKLSTKVIDRLGIVAVMDGDLTLWTLTTLSSWHMGRLAIEGLVTSKMKNITLDQEHSLYQHIVDAA